MFENKNRGIRNMSLAGPMYLDHKYTHLQNRDILLEFIGMVFAPLISVHHRLIGRSRAGRHINRTGNNDHINVYTYSYSQVSRSQVHTSFHDELLGSPLIIKRMVLQPLAAVAYRIQDFY